MKISITCIATFACVSVTHSLECAMGYGEKVMVIPESWIDDGFCDCPLDALDELHTEACSGAPIGGWSGVRKQMTTSPTFQCPEQKNKKIPLSRLNDGVCDCCDGADEADYSCENICDTVLAAERAARAKAEKDFASGSEKRKEALARFESLAKETMVEIEQIEEELRAKNQELEIAESELDMAKLSFVEHRRGELMKVLNTVINVVDEDSLGVSGLLTPLSNEELKLLIQLTCQLSGEMEGSVKSKTCVPLRLAGVDLGILWSDEKFNDVSVDLISVSEAVEGRWYSELVVRNQLGDMIWSEKSAAKHGTSKGRRRLDDYMDDDFHVDDDETESYDRSEFDDHSESYDDSHKSQDENIEVYEPVATIEQQPGKPVAKVDVVKGLVEGSLFSQTRMRFLKHADHLAALIENTVESKQKEADDREESEDNLDNEKVSNESVADEKKDADVTSFDSIAYNMAKATLKRRSQAIRRGLQYALSAYILVAAVNNEKDDAQARTDLLNLAGATLMHSRASAEHIWRILSTILGEFHNTNADEAQACSSPLASLCPTKVFSKNGQDYPPRAIVLAGETVCSRALDELNTSFCLQESPEVIVTSIPDGYYGYHEIRPREGDDKFHILFSYLEKLNPSSVTDVEAKLEALEKEKKSLQAKMTSLEDRIGGRDPHESFKGELHALKGSCFSVLEGKYDYEVCIHGKASQKDKGATSGTSLGRWKGMEIDEQTGDRVMKWTNGQSCWNGPERSATVIVKCGAETTLLSAEEPDTCTYLLQMESYIACDNTYFEKFNNSY